MLKNFILKILFVSVLNISFLSTFSQKNNNLSNDIIYALIEASRLKVMGNIEEALKIYKSCINSYPDCAAGWYEAGKILMNIGNTTEAENYLKRSYDIDPQNYWYGLAYSDALAINKNYIESNRIIKKLKNKFPEEEILLKFQIAENFFNDKKYSKSINYLNDIERRFGPSEMVTVRKIEIFKLKKNNKNIEKEFQKVFNINPGNLSLNILYAEYLFESKKFNKAITQYENILNLDEDNIFAISNLAELYKVIGEKEKADEFLIKTFKSDLIPASKKIQMISFLLNDEKHLKSNQKTIEEIILILSGTESNNYEYLLVAYDFYHKIENYEKAFPIIKKVTDLKQDNYIIWAQALYNGIQIESYKEVVNLGEKALKIFPNKDDLRVLIAIGNFHLNEYEVVYEMLKNTGENFDEPVLKMQKNILLAESAFKINKINEAFSIFEMLIKEFPDNLIIKNNYSYYLALEKKDLEKAKKLSLETIKSDPKSSTFLDTYGWILFQMEDFDNAEKFIRDAVKYSSEINEEIIEHLVEVLIKNNKYSEAEYYMKKLKIKNE